MYYYSTTGSATSGVSSEESTTAKHQETQNVRFEPNGLRVVFKKSGETKSLEKSRDVIPGEELTKEEEDKFYKRVVKTTLLTK